MICVLEARESPYNNKQVSTHAYRMGVELICLVVLKIFPISKTRPNKLNAISL
jgi:hypothetical protein